MSGAGVRQRIGSPIAGSGHVAVVCVRCSRDSQDLSGPIARVGARTDRAPAGRAQRGSTCSPIMASASCDVCPEAQLLRVTGWLTSHRVAESVPTTMRHPVRTIAPWRSGSSGCATAASAAEALRAAIAAVKGDDPLAPVTVVVPSNHVGVATRRLLASGALGPICARGVGLAAVTFVTPTGWPSCSGAPALAGAGRRPVSTPVIAAALRAALADDAGPVRAGRRSTPRPRPRSSPPTGSCARSRRPASTRSPRPGRAPPTSCGSTARRARELETDWYDEQDLMAAAADVAARRRGRPRSSGAVVVYLPQRLSRHAGALLAAVAEVDRRRRSSPGRTGDGRRRRRAGRAAPPRSTHDAPDPPTVRPTRRRRRRPHPDRARPPTPTTRCASRCAPSSTPCAPARRSTASPSSTPAAEPYARLAARAPRRRRDRRRTGRPSCRSPGGWPGRVLLDLLALPERGFRRQDVFAWLASAPLLARRAVGADRGVGAAVPRGRRRRRRGRLGRAPRGDRRRQRRPGRRRRRRPRRSRRGGPNACARTPSRARELRDFVARPDRRPRRRGGAAAAAGASTPRWARRHLARPPRRARPPRAVARRRSARPPSGSTPRSTGSPRSTTSRARSASTCSRAPSPSSSSPTSAGSAASATACSSARSRWASASTSTSSSCSASPRAPSRRPSATTRCSPTTSGRPPAASCRCAAQRVDRQHRELLAALAGAPRRVLGVPAATCAAARERVPSRWVLDIASALAGERVVGRGPARAPTPSGSSTSRRSTPGCAGCAFPATEQEHRLRTLLVAAPRRRGRPRRRRRRRRARGRRGDRGGPPQRRLHPLRRQPGRARRAVAGRRAPRRPPGSRRWAGCPFAYFVQDVLGVERGREPRGRAQITPLDQGNLVHEALERFILEVLDPAAERAARARRSRGRPPTGPAWPRSARSCATTTRPAGSPAGRSSGAATGPASSPTSQRFLDEDDRNRRTPPHPAGRRRAGLRAARRRPSTRCRSTLPDGRAAALPGQGRPGRRRRRRHASTSSTTRPASPRDYTRPLRGRPRPARPPAAARRLRRGRPRSTAGRRTPTCAPSTGSCRTKGEFKRIGYPVTDDVLARVGATLGTIVAGIEAGVFASHPTAVSSSPWVECAACDPDGLGVTELRRRLGAQARRARRWPPTPSWPSRSTTPRPRSRSSSRR